MSERYDLNKLLEFARQQGVSFVVDYCEPSDEMSIEIQSAAKAECYYQKRIACVEIFISNWWKQLGIKK